jgi:hypothetical protein
MRLWRSKRGCCQVRGHKEEVKCSKLILKRKVNLLNESMQADHPWKCWEVTCSLFFYTITSCVWCHWILDLGNLHLFFFTVLLQIRDFPLRCVFPCTLSPSVWTNFLDWFKFLFVLDGLVLLCPLKMVLNSLASWGCFGRCILSAVVWFSTFEVHGTSV